MNRENRGFTLFELLVLLAIISVLATMLLPPILSMREKANGMDCLNNLRQFGVAIDIYADEHNNEIPAVSGLLAYLDDPHVLVCPKDRRGSAGPSKPSYTTHAATPRSTLPSDIHSIYSDQIILVESDQAGIKDPSSITALDVAIRHGLYTHALHLDGHVVIYTEAELPQLSFSGVRRKSRALTTASEIGKEKGRF